MSWCDYDKGCHSLKSVEDAGPSETQIAVNEIVQRPHKIRLATTLYSHKASIRWDRYAVAVEDSVFFDLRLQDIDSP